jgi:phosphoglycolate phosphatase-like HAD superfamily hydrolase
MDHAISLLTEHDIKVVVFDMDQTAIVAHSRGCLSRRHLEDYLNKASQDFLDLVPQLHARGIHLAIATHSDAAEYSCLVRPDTHVLGQDLAQRMVDYHFDPIVAQAFFIVAYNPRVRKATEESNLFKRHHMRVIREHFSQVEPKNILFFDDVLKIVQDCNEYCGVRAVLVDERKGFQLSDLVNTFQH